MRLRSVRQAQPGRVAAPRCCAAMPGTDGPGDPHEVAVVMSVVDSKDTPAHLKKHILTDDQVETFKRRFKKFDDPLSFVVVTAKLMTGFAAPIEGVLYLDKPLRAANFIQTITRPNRPWKNPVTVQRKEFGRVVEYIGLAKAIGEALLGPDTEGQDDDPDKVNATDIPQLVASRADVSPVACASSVTDLRSRPRAHDMHRLPLPTTPQDALTLTTNPLRRSCSRVICCRGSWVSFTRVARGGFFNPRR